MNIPQIAQKYKISEAFLNSKDDAFSIVAVSLKDMQTGIKAKYNDTQIHKDIQLLIDLLTDIQHSGY